MTRTRVTVLSAAAVVLLAGFVHGTWTQRWLQSAELEAAVARLDNIPTRVGGWTASEVEAIPPEELKLAGAAGCWMRRFTAADSGQKVQVVILVGHTGRMSVHRPENCYPGQGYDLAGAPLRYSLKTPDAEFWTARFTKPDVTTGGSQLRIFWTWNAAGQWKAPENPRWTFAALPYLYKLYVIRSLPERSERAEDDPAAEFLRQFLPELSKGARAGITSPLRTTPHSHERRQLLREFCSRLPPRWREPPLVAAATAGYMLGFFLFLLLNAILFIRPTEFIPDLLGLELYQMCIIACLLVSFPAMLFQLAPRELEQRPITVCLFGVALAIVATSVVHAGTVDFFDANVEFAKIILYYLLFLGVVTTPERLRRFIFWLPAFCTIIAELTLMQFYGWIQLPTLNPLREHTDPTQFSEDGIVVRLMATGIFQDPNDLCVLLAFAIVLSLYWLTDKRSGLLRFTWLLPLAILGTALMHTQSRGGFLALVIGLVLLMRSRFDWKRTLLVGALVLPALFYLVGQRQTDLTTGVDTGQTRVQLWSDGLLMLRQSPLFGIGKDRFGAEAGQVAHNSFVHAFTELGPFGGMMFLGAFYLALRALWRLGSAPSPTRSRPGSHAALFDGCGGQLHRRHDVALTDLCLADLHRAGHRRHNGKDGGRPRRAARDARRSPFAGALARLERLFSGLHLYLRSPRDDARLRFIFVFWFLCGVRRGIAALGFSFSWHDDSKNKNPKRRCLAALHTKT